MITLPTIPPTCLLSPLHQKTPSTTRSTLRMQLWSGNQSSRQEVVSFIWETLAGHLGLHYSTKCIVWHAFARRWTPANQVFTYITASIICARWFYVMRTLLLSRSSRYWAGGVSMLKCRECVGTGPRFTKLQKIITIRRWTTVAVFSI